MAALIFKRPITRQPQGACWVDRNNPLTRGMVGFWYATGTGFRSAIHGIPNGLPSSNSRQATRAKGRVAASITQAAEPVVSIANDPRYLPTGAITVLTEGLTPITNYFGYSTEVSSNGWGSYSLAGSVQVYTFTDGGSFYYEVSAGSGPAASAQWGMTYDGATLYGVGNGKTVGSIAATSAIKNSAGPLYLGASPKAAGGYGEGQFLYLAIWNRALNARELAGFYTNPWQVLSEGAALLAAPSDGGVSAVLTGVSSTGAGGTVAPSTSKAITGNAATGAPGTTGAQTSQAITGNAATGAVGSVTPVRSGNITGVSGAGTAGTVSPTTAKALTGNSGATSVGTVSPSTIRALTGVAASGAAGAVTSGVTVGLIGASAAGAVGSVSAGADATQALTGVSGAGAAGAIALLTGAALTGTSAPGAVGSVSPRVTRALSGVSVTGEAGSVAFVSGDLTIALTGVQAVGAVGAISVAGEFSDIAAAFWSHVLSNGKTAGQDVVEIRAAMDGLDSGFWGLPIEGVNTAADLLRVIAAVQAGESNITSTTPGTATVEFSAVDGSEVRVTADMNGSERTAVTLNVD